MLAVAAVALLPPNTARAQATPAATPATAPATSPQTDAAPSTHGTVLFERHADPAGDASQQADPAPATPPAPGTSSSIRRRHASPGLQTRKLTPDAASCTGVDRCSTNGGGAATVNPRSDGRARHVSRCFSCGACRSAVVGHGTRSAPGPAHRRHLGARKAPRPKQLCRSLAVSSSANLRVFAMAGSAAGGKRRHIDCPASAPAPAAHGRRPYRCSVGSPSHAGAAVGSRRNPVA